jgi:hypothetical protein
MFSLKKYISDIIVDNKTKLKAIEIQSLLIIFILLLNISELYILPCRPLVFIPVFRRVHVIQALVSSVMICRSLKIFVFCFLLVIALYVLRLTSSDYTFDIFNKKINIIKRLCISIAFNFVLLSTMISEM